MGTSANQVGRWAVIGAIIITALMIVFWLTGGEGKIAFGMSMISLSIAAFLLLFYSPMNTVQRTGWMSLTFVVFIALILPFFLFANSKTAADATTTQYDTRLHYAAGKYATYCASCHGLLGQRINGPQVNNSLASMVKGLDPAVAVNKNLALLAPTDIYRIINAGIVDSTDPKLTTYLMPQWGQQYNGPFNDDDMNALVALITSSDPTLRDKTKPPIATNGFTYVFDQLTSKDQANYKSQTAQLTAPKGTPADLTALTAVTMPMVNTPGAAVSWNFIYTDPKVGQTPIIKIKAGTKVTWGNQSNIAHSVHSGAPGNDDNKFPTIAIINPGDSASTVFATPGTYPFYCSFHPAMQGTVIVV